jgi:hypothetical protein
VKIRFCRWLGKPPFKVSWRNQLPDFDEEFHAFRARSSQLQCGGARDSMKGFFIFVGLLIALYIFWESFEISRPGGVLVPDEPYQREVYGGAPFDKNGFQITPLATFDIRARVIAAARYRFGHDADLAPVDLVLGWGPMSDSDVLKKISFSQRGRAYTWMTSTYPVSRRVIETHSANMHIIPADGEIERQLKSIRPGYMVHLEGHLVEVTSKEGWRWKSSLTRNDTGGGSCELILVRSLYVW